ncbi:glycosyl hydrolase [Petrimonas sp.]|jgi:hypothetical protein|uniref:glycosyl hydrolase n=1 Tax=Petrimonas sp. TaxID=2023866 RepID=UPI002B2581ED|nr:glycosyl hydrolase [Petrimonas sp.]
MRSFVVLLLVTLYFPVSGQSQRWKGYPDKTYDRDLLKHFASPPAGYGNVPFYWWNGDSLRRERLQEQLEILSSAAVDGFAVSYIHTSPRIDTLENKNGYGLFGMTEPGVPPVFSEEWWEIWNWFSGEAGRRGLGAGLDDYTVGWHGNGYYPDELDTVALFRNYKGELVIKVDTLRGGETYDMPVPDNLLTVVAWPGKVVLSDNIQGGRIRWSAPGKGVSQVYTITTAPGYVIHPEHGNKLLDVYFNRFEQKMDDAGRAGMNYFFQDELAYPIRVLTWSDDFSEEFIRRKGYDIVPYLPALKAWIGPVTPRIRMDYCEVLMDLSEERYYKPIYQWHADRGLMYGCDNLGRGKEPVAYIDYFRAMSWFTAPGNDAPARGSSFLETKVSSSIAHLYRRPRTWLEAFHSMGWGSSGAWLTDQIDHHFIAGGNLVCMHGLYYSTHGGWWEWAPPDFHFRMPYWPHMKRWLDYTERMSFLLSQGSHVCDIALIYPTEAIQAYPSMKPDSVFDLALKLSNGGLDFDFVDFRSLREANIIGRELQMADERYKILIMADMQAMHHSSLLQALAFYRAGGIVLATGKLPKATTSKGEDDPEVETILRELFGLTAAEAAEGKAGKKQVNGAGGVGWYIPDAPEREIAGLITPDFQPEHGAGKVLHRRVGDKDIYMVKDVEKGSESFFRATGRVELWDAHNGTAQVCPVLSQDESGTRIRMNRETGNSYLIVFSPGEPLMADEESKTLQLRQTVALEKEWQTELLPTLQNKWGDFRFPAFDGMIGAEARTFRFTPDNGVAGDWMKPDYDDSKWEEGIYGYGPQFMTSADGTPWIPLSFSWQYGVWDNPGAQGYHGLKGKVDDRFLILDKGENQRFKTHLYAPEKGSYRIVSEGVIPSQIRIDSREVNGVVHLKKGWHLLEVQYDRSEQVEYKPRTGLYNDTRRRGMVLLYPEGVPIPEKPSRYAEAVSSRWGAGGHLMYDPYGGAYRKWIYRFKAVPGLEEMTMALHGELTDLWIDGEPVAKSRIHHMGDHRYRVVLSEKRERTATVAFRVRTEIGYQGTAVLCGPIELKTSTGLMKSGDWSQEGALRHYSGGIRYRQSYELEKIEGARQVMLSLGDVIATCEVTVNGQSAGVLISPPYELDVTEMVKEGANEIEVLVYSTLSNHYQTIPTPYRGDPGAGLIGPVSLSVYE